MKLRNYKYNIAIRNMKNFIASGIFTRYYYSKRRKQVTIQEHLLNETQVGPLHDFAMEQSLNHSSGSKEVEGRVIKVEVSTYLDEYNAIILEEFKKEGINVEFLSNRTMVLSGSGESELAISISKANSILSEVEKRGSIDDALNLARPVIHTIGERIGERVIGLIADLLAGKRLVRIKTTITTNETEVFRAVQSIGVRYATMNIVIGKSDFYKDALAKKLGTYNAIMDIDTLTPIGAGALLKDVYYQEYLSKELDEGSDIGKRSLNAACHIVTSL